MRLPLSLLAVLFAATVSACTGVSDARSGGGSPASGGQIVLTGSSTMAPLAAEIAKRFESLHPGVRVDVQAGGSSRGVADVRRGHNDIGMASRALKDAEAGLFAFTIAQDGIGLIVHGDNPVPALSDDQVVAIYTGEISNWQAVGGPDAPITVVHKAEGRSTLELFLHYFGLKNSQVRPQVVIGDNEQGIKTVAGNPGAIGYVSIGTAAYDVAHGVPIRLLPVGGVAATIENVKNGTFPISRPLNLVTARPPDGWAARFVEFARSPQVHDLVGAQYYVPLPG